MVTVWQEGVQPGLVTDRRCDCRSRAAATSASAPGRLFVNRPAGSPSVELAIPAALGIAHPVWSPDGQQPRAFVCFVDQTNADLCTINKNGTGFTRLTDAIQFLQGRPRVESGTASGSRFTRGAEIVIIAVADGRVTRLIDGREPSWSPDGFKLVFASGRWPVHHRFRWPGLSPV